MSKAARTPQKVRPAIAITAIVLLLTFLLWIISIYIHIPFALAGQIYALIAMLLGFRYWPPMARLVSRMPVPHRIIFGVIIAAMILGHVTIRPRAYFPFISWEIFPFVHVEDPVTVPEFIGTTAGGHKVRLLVEQLFPSIVQFYLPDDAQHPGATERLAKAMAQVYNDHHPDDPVRRVDLMLMAVKLHPPANESRDQPSCELLIRYDISSGR